MSIWIDRGDEWVPYTSEPLTCAACGSANCRRAKKGEPPRDVLICLNCDHVTDRWDRTKGVVK
jgi:hypothetical protein